MAPLLVLAEISAGSVAQSTAILNVFTPAVKFGQMTPDDTCLHATLSFGHCGSRLPHGQHKAHQVKGFLKSSP